MRPPPTEYYCTSIPDRTQTVDVADYLVFGYAEPMSQAETPPARKPMRLWLLEFALLASAVTILLFGGYQAGNEEGNGAVRTVTTFPMH